ncbi:hypothetical protein [Carboxylicivirga marina]|uniref:DUF4476 domain-containing protein n=1 Tax=Carboxylicivirga marina TaxID=2800988 RepID=A0ABS1HG08_9BACT|nr:hypothetical protein [Carboxylicivirga marina]MBK3516569.1 hypothetical protein [Carboxylicivirga marina]
MKALLLFLPFGIFCCFSTQSAIAQSIKSTPFSSDTLSAIDIHNNTFSNELDYINGREYKPYHHPDNENPYLNSSQGSGSIFIDGREFTDKRIIYDINKDELIVNPNFFKFAGGYIQLKKSAIDSFTIHFEEESYTLTNFKEQYEKLGLSSGFYQQIHQSDNSSLLIRHFVTTGINNSVKTYTYQTKRLLFINHYFHNISAKRRLLALFPDDKKKIRRKIKSINYSYKKMNNKQLKNLIKYIDTL